VIFLLWATSRTIGVDAFENLPTWLERSYHAVWTSVATGTAGFGLALFKIVTRRPDSSKPNYLLFIGITTVAMLILIYFLPRLFRRDHSESSLPVSPLHEPNSWVKIANTGNLKFEEARNYLAVSGSVTGIVSNPSLDVFLLYRIIRECGPFLGERVVPGRPVPGGCIDPVEDWHVSAATVDAVGNWAASPCVIPRTYAKAHADFDYWEVLAVATRERSAVGNQVVQMTCGISADALCRTAGITTSEPRVVLRTTGPGYAIWQEYAPSPRSACLPK
jgi:hypothetical protein